MCAAPVASAPTLPSIGLLEAASDLLSMRGPAQVSVEEISEAANVRPATIRRIWPGEHDTSRACLDYLGELIGAALGPERPDEKLGDLLVRALGATESNRRYWRILTWCLLAGDHPMDLRTDYPVMGRLLRAAARSPGHSASPEALVAGIAGAGMGLLIYGPYLQVAMGQGPAKWARTRSELVTLLRRLMLRAERRGTIH